MSTVPDRPRTMRTRSEVSSRALVVPGRRAVMKSVRLTVPVAVSNTVSSTSVPGR